MPNIASSIQEYCKKINSSLSWADVASLGITAFWLLGLLVYIVFSEKNEQKAIVYKEGKGGVLSSVSDNSKKDVLPFGSASGKTYTFSWCRGAGRLSEKNKLYFPDEAAAVAAGRTLSKLCIQ